MKTDSQASEFSRRFQNLKERFEKILEDFAKNDFAKQTAKNGLDSLFKMHVMVKRTWDQIQEADQALGDYAKDLTKDILLNQLEALENLAELAEGKAHVPRPLGLSDRQLEKIGNLGIKALFKIMEFA